MSLSDYIPNIISAPEGYVGLLGADPTKKLEKQANLQGLLGVAASLAQGMSSQGPRRSALQNILGSLSSGYGATQQAYQGGLQQFGVRQQLAQGNRAMVLQQQKDAVMQKLQRGEQLTQNDYAILNPEAAAKTQFESMQLQKVLGAQPSDSSIPPVVSSTPVVEQPVAPPVSGEYVPTRTVNEFGTISESAAPIKYEIRGINDAAPVVSQQNTAQAVIQAAQPVQQAAPSNDIFNRAIEIRKNITNLNSPAGFAIAGRKDIIDGLSKELSDIETQLARTVTPGDPFADFANNTALAPAIRKQAAIQSQRANTPGGFANSQQKFEAYKDLQSQAQTLQAAQDLRVNPASVLAKVHPTLKPRVAALDAQKGFLPADKIIEQQNNILVADANIREKLDPAMARMRLDEATAMGGGKYKSEQAVFDRSTSLRKEFLGEQIMKDFAQVKTAYSQIKTALNNPSPAADLAAATKFMKLLDPGSVVRESELGMAMAASGLEDRARNYFDTLMKGEKLTKTQRIDFAKTTELLYKAAENQILPRQSYYRDLAINAGVNPNDVVSPGASGAGAPAVSPNQQIIDAAKKELEKQKSKNKGAK
jgi:hypothetical protein